MKKVFISGCLGQLGSELTKQCLSKGWLVYGFDNLSTGAYENLSNDIQENSNFILFKDLTKLPALKFDYIFHCAAFANIVDSIKDPASYFYNNVYLTQSLLDYSRIVSSKAKFIYCASSSCYGDNPPLPTNEDAPINCKYPYSLTKYMAEELVIHYAKVYKLPYISFRIFNIYSPYIKKGGGYNSVIKTFARAWLELNKPILKFEKNINELKELNNDKRLIVIGDGTQKRDFLFVSDAARALIMGAESDIQNEIFNLGADNPQTINYLIELMFGKGYPRNPMPARPGEPLVTWADITKVKKVLGWEPEITFEQGMKELMDNIENYRNFDYFDETGYKKVHELWYHYLQ